MLNTDSLEVTGSFTSDVSNKWCSHFLKGAVLFAQNINNCSFLSCHKIAMICLLYVCDFEANKSNVKKIQTFSMPLEFLI
jgi:hypothetical protein